MSYYYNAAGQRFPLSERPLEPPDLWVDVPKSQAPGILDKKELPGATNTEQPKQTPHDT